MPPLINCVKASRESGAGISGINDTRCEGTQTMRETEEKTLMNQDADQDQSIRKQSNLKQMEFHPNMTITVNCYKLEFHL